MSAVPQQGVAQIKGTAVMSLADTGLRQISDRWMWELCKGKIRHATRGVAEAACRSLIRLGMDRARELRRGSQRAPPPSQAMA